MDYLIEFDESCDAPLRRLRRVQGGPGGDDVCRSSRPTATAHARSEWWITAAIGIGR
jgi:hypothetical protein